MGFLKKNFQATLQKSGYTAYASTVTERLKQPPIKELREAVPLQTTSETAPVTVVTPVQDTPTEALPEEGMIARHERREVKLPDSHFRPKDSRHLWCPFCGEVKRFKMGENDALRCTACGISDHEFYVRKANHLFSSKDEHEAKKRKDAKREARANDRDDDSGDESDI